MSHRPQNEPEPEDRDDDDSLLPVKLGRGDRRRLYGLLEQDIVNRLRRIEYGGIALTAAVASPKLGGPSVHEVVGGFLQLFT